MSGFRTALEDAGTIHWLNSLTPIALLIEANKGFKPRDIDLDLITELRELGFADGIINVMLYYVLVRSRGLRFDEVRALAAVWHEKVLIVEDAVILAEEAFLQWQESRPVSVKPLRGPGWKDLHFPS